MTQSNDGMITVDSGHDVPETVARLRVAIEGAGLRVFEHIDHAANAAEVGTALRPTQLLVFGHPRAGTILMADQQTAGLDLPMRVLIWEDERGRTRMTFNDAAWIVRRHGVGAAAQATVRAIAEGMATLTAAVSPSGTGEHDARRVVPSVDTSVHNCASRNTASSTQTMPMNDRSARPAQASVSASRAGIVQCVPHVDCSAGTGWLGTPPCADSDCACTTSITRSGCKTARISPRWPAACSSLAAS